MNKMILMNNGEGKRMTKDELQELIGDLGGITLTKDRKMNKYNSLESAMLIAYLRAPLSKEGEEEIYKLKDRLWSNNVKVELSIYNAIIPEEDTNTRLRKY